MIGQLVTALADAWDRLGLPYDKAARAAE